MPDTAWPVGGHPPGLSRDSRYIPVSMSPVFVSTRHQRFACARLPDPHLTHQVRLFPHRSPRQSSANAAVGGLKPPPAGRLRRAYLHLPRSTASRGSTYIELLSAFVTHTCANAQHHMPCHVQTAGPRFPRPRWQPRSRRGANVHIRHLHRALADQIRSWRIAGMAARDGGSHTGRPAAGTAGNSLCCEGW